MKTRFVPAAALLAVTVAVIPSAVPASGNDRYEVWAIDQSNSAGTTSGGTLYVWDGHDLERGHTGPRAVPERVDLGGAVAAMCIAETGAAPVRPHMVAINAGQSHGIISFVASVHVVFLDADTREPVACIRTSAGAGGPARHTSPPRHRTRRTSPWATRTASSWSGSPPTTTRRRSSWTRRR